MKKVIIFCLLCTANLALFSIEWIEEEVFYTLTGEWVENIHDIEYPEEEMSWGMSKVNPISSVLIDLLSRPPYISNGASFIYIAKIDRIGIDVIRIYGNDKEVFTFHIEESGSIWFEEKNMGPNQYDKQLRKLDGPKIEFNGLIYTTDYYLNVRAEGRIDSRKIKIINPGSLFIITEKGRSDTINGVQGIWMKIKLIDGSEGWCFSAYIRVSIVNRLQEP